MKYFLAFLATLVVAVIMEIGDRFLNYGPFYSGWISCYVWCLVLEYFKNN